VEDILNWAARQLQDIRERHATTFVRIGMTFETSVELPCTPVGIKTLTSGNEVQQQAQHTRLVFRSQDLDNHGIVIQRGLKLWLDDNVYEIAMQGRNLFEYNDLVTRLDIVLQFVWKEKR